MEVCHCSYLFLYGTALYVSGRAFVPGESRAAEIYMNEIINKLKPRKGDEINVCPSILCRPRCTSSQEGAQSAPNREVTRQICHRKHDPSQFLKRHFLHEYKHNVKLDNIETWGGKNWPKRGRCLPSPSSPPAAFSVRHWFEGLILHI